MASFANVWLLLTIHEAGVLGILFPFLMEETYPHSLLEAKTKKLRKETGNVRLRSKTAHDTTATAYFKLSIIRPLKLLFRSPIVAILGFYMALFYGYICKSFDTFSDTVNTMSSCANLIRSGLHYYL